MQAKSNKKNYKSILDVALCSSLIVGVQSKFESPRKSQYLLDLKKEKEKVNGKYVTPEIL